MPLGSPQAVVIGATGRLLLFVPSDKQDLLLRSLDEGLLSLRNAPDQWKKVGEHGGEGGFSVVAPKPCSSPLLLLLLKEAWLAGWLALPWQTELYKKGSNIP